jgi:hypothetical protein
VWNMTASTTQHAKLWRNTNRYTNKAGGQGSRPTELAYGVDPIVGSLAGSAGAMIMKDGYLTYQV